MPKGIYLHKPHSEEYKKNMSLVTKGHSVSAETKRKIIAVRKANNTYKHSEATKAKIKATRLNHPVRNWKGGVTQERIKFGFYKKVRRAKLLGSGGSHTLAEWENLKAQYNWTCPCCHRAEPTIKLTEDHIGPVSKGGSNNIENIQPLCQSCNSKKYTKIINYQIL